MSTAPNDDGFYTLAQFLALYSLGKSKGYEEIAAGRLAAQKLGKLTVIRKAEARRWADALPLFTDPGVKHGAEHLRRPARVAA